MEAGREPGYADPAQRPCAIGLSLSRREAASCDVVMQPRSDHLPARRAELRLRGLDPSACVLWPSASGTDEAPPLLVFFPAHSGAESCTPVSPQPGVIVLSAPLPPTATRAAVATMWWAADHAHELGADPARLQVGGEGSGLLLANHVALHAAAFGWPVIERQILVHRNFSSDVDFGSPRSTER